MRLPFLSQIVLLANCVHILPFLPSGFSLSVSSREKDFYSHREREIRPTHTHTMIPSQLMAASTATATAPDVDAPVAAASCFSYTMGEMIAQCAESKIYTCDFFGCPAICKHRFEKRYRHPKLDQKLREQRTVREARALVRSRKQGIRVPAVYAVDKQLCQIVMERIDGCTVKELLDEEQKREKTTRQAARTSPTKVTESPPRSRKCPRDSADASAGLAGNEAAEPSARTSQLLHGIGEVVGLLHNADIIHGDLTTSNVLWQRVPAPSQEANAVTSTVSEGGGDEDTFKASGAADRDGLVVIDFGLVTDKNSAEERAVDLYVLERAIASSHPFVESYASRLIVEGYSRTVDAKKGQATLARLEVVRARGRKRSMVG